MRDFVCFLNEIIIIIIIIIINVLIKVTLNVICRRGTLQRCAPASK